MRDDLDRFSQINAPAFSFNNVLVYFPSSDVMLPGQCDIQIALIVALVEIYFSSVIKHEDFSMLLGRHGSSIDVYVGVDLDHCHAQTLGFEKQPGTGCFG